MTGTNFHEPYSLCVNPAELSDAKKKRVPLATGQVRRVPAVLGSSRNRSPGANAAQVFGQTGWGGKRDHNRGNIAVPLYLPPDLNSCLTRSTKEEDMRGIGCIVICLLLPSSGHAIGAVSSWNGSRDCASSIGYVTSFKPLDRTPTPDIDTPSLSNHRMFFPTNPGRGYEIRSAFPSNRFRSISEDSICRWHAIYRGLMEAAAHR